MFRKEFAILGIIFGCFIFLSLAFPNGMVESTAAGCIKCAGMPAWKDVIIFCVMLVIAAPILAVTTTLFHFIHVSKDTIEALKRTWKVLTGEDFEK